MRIVAALLCAALASSWGRPARTQEAQPDFTGLEAGASPIETYRLNALGIVREETSASFPTIFVGRSKWWRPVRGKFRYSTSYSDFFLKIGRDDLGAQHRHQYAIAAALFWGGALVTVGGLGVALSGFGSHHDTRAEVGLGMFAGGVVLTSIGSGVQPPLVSQDDAEAMAEAYNRKLQVHLGLTPVSGARGTDLRPLGLTVSRRW
ncbi:MAG TPA: hypothetical protein VMT03_12460 [Polyangia bacterium]|nr:hypothetical protein [Polyangia bacterium]